MQLYQLMGVIAGTPSFAAPVGRDDTEKRPCTRQSQRKAHAVRMTERYSVPLSGSNTSPGRPRIWRMSVPGRGKPKRSNFSVAGSKRYTALPVHSLTHT